MMHGTDSMDSPIHGTFGNGSVCSAEPEPQYSLKMFGRSSRPSASGRG